MQINKIGINNINFQANYVTNISISKKNKNCVYGPFDASIVKIDYNNGQDISALEKVGKKWIGNIFCDDIKECAQAKPNSKNTNLILAITTQKNDGSIEHSLDYRKILCLINVNQNFSKTRIYHIESIPKKISNEYNNMGTAFIKYIQSKTKKIELFCPSVSIIKEFYYKLGFRHKYPESKLLKNYGELYWKKDSNFIQDKILSLYNKFIFCIKK